MEVAGQTWTRHPNTSPWAGITPSNPHGWECRRGRPHGNWDEHPYFPKTEEWIESRKHQPMSTTDTGPSFSPRVSPQQGNWGPGPAGVGLKSLTLPAPDPAPTQQTHGISGSHVGGFVRGELDDEVPSLPGLFPGQETLFWFVPTSEVL